ncbi:MAG TPA: hypothetical protein VJV78_01850, partial [Polyangiales bacterium]|nr:hypothetical protein [Polyangiales bacterium]
MRNQIIQLRLLGALRPPPCVGGEASVVALDQLAFDVCPRQLELGQPLGAGAATSFGRRPLQEFLLRTLFEAQP